MRIASGVTDQYLYFVAVDATDLKTRETGLSSFTVYRSRNGGAAAAYTTPTINETDATNMPGVYELLLDEDMTIDSGDETQEVALHITHTGMAPVTRVFELYRPKITAGNTLGVESDGDLTKVNTLDGHTAQTGDSFARIGAPVGASLSADLQVIDTNVDDIETDTADMTANGVFLTAAGVDAIWDEATSGHVSSGSFGQRLASIRAATAQAGAAGTITLDASADATDDFYNNTLLVITGGTGAGQSRIIEDYTGSTKVATVNPNWVTTPSSDSVFVIIPFDDIPGASAPSASSIADAVWDEDIEAAHGADAAAGLLLRVLGSAISDRSNNATLDALLGVADSAGVDLPEQVWSETARVLTANTNFNDPTAAAIADAVWDETASDHVTAGTTGAILRGGGVRSSTAQAGAAGSITLDASASATNSLYTGMRVTIISGTGAGQTRVITAYTGSTKVATVVPNWTTNPSSDSVFVISPAHVNMASWRLSQPNALVSSRVDTTVGAMQSSVLTATAIATDAITAAKIAADAIGSSEFAQAAADKVWSSTTRTVSAATNITSTGGTTVPQTGDSFARLGAPAGASIAADIASVLSKLLKYVQLLARKDAAIATDNATELTAINADGGSGAGAFDNTTEALESLRDNLALTGEAATQAEVATEISDALTSDTVAEPTTVVGASASISAMLAWLKFLARNRLTFNKSTGVATIYADNTTIARATSTASDDDTTVDRGEWT